jgi:demethylmenaquinone methyltransferase / 2-methoxy-6-polyprenyl-1,4-benzoquinol methylase
MSTITEEEEALSAAAGGRAKRAYVRRIFSEIAPRYDFLNHVLSANVDRGWRRRAIAALRWERDPRGTYVDLCAGTLDIGAALASRAAFAGQVIGADFAEPMLRAGAAKSRALPVRAIVADALCLPLPDASCAGIIVAFGARNFDDLDAGLREMLRVTAPGGRLVVLDCSTPRAAAVRVPYRFYFHHVLPVIGRVVSGHRTAYRYLPGSVDNFPDGDGLARRMRAAGIANVGWAPLTFGIAALHWGERAA